MAGKGKKRQVTSIEVSEDDDQETNEVADDDLNGEEDDQDIDEEDSNDEGDANGIDEEEGDGDGSADEEAEEIGDSTSDNYTDDSDDEEEDSDEDVDIDEDADKVGQASDRIEYESPDAIQIIDSGDEANADGAVKPKKRKVDTNGTSDGQDNGANGSGDVPVKVPRPKLFKSARDKSQRLIVILERSNMELVKTNRNNYELINCDDHMGLIRKYKKDPAFCRPDITHQCLLMLFDSPLNRAGLLQVYIHTINNLLIEINPQTRFPRTFKRFANLMVQLLYRMSIKSASGGNQKLLRVIKNPITSHLPVGCKKYGTSFQSDKLVHPTELVPDNDTDVIAIVIGAMAHGQTGADYVEENVSISQYPLSGALACTKICSAFEDKWGIH